MKLIDIYNLIKNRFPEKVDAGLLGDPTAQPDIGVQFVNQYGLPVPPSIANPSSFMLARPFAGPFYQMEVMGWTLAVTPQMTGTQYIYFFVSDAVNVYLSAPLVLNVSIDTLKGLSAELGNKWYANESPIRLPEFPSLDELITHEHKRYEERIREYENICGENSRVQSDR